MKRLHRSREETELLHEVFGFTAEVPIVHQTMVDLLFHYPLVRLTLLDVADHALGSHQRLGACTKERCQCLAHQAHISGIKKVADDVSKIRNTFGAFELEYGRFCTFCFSSPGSRPNNFAFRDDVSCCLLRKFLLPPINMH